MTPHRDHPNGVITSHPAAGDAQRRGRHRQPGRGRAAEARRSSRCGASSTAAPRRRARGRRRLSFLLVLGCGLVAMSLIAVYVRATVLNTDRYVDDDGADRREPGRPAGGGRQARQRDHEPGRLRRADARGAARRRPTRSLRRWRARCEQAIRSRLDAFVASDRLPDAVGGGQPARALARRGAAHHRRVETAAAGGRHRLPRPRRGGRPRAPGPAGARASTGSRRRSRRPSTGA